MPVHRVPDRARGGASERVDLCQQYRPIGIGAVAAALSVNGNARRSEAENIERAAAEANEIRYMDSLAA